MRTPSTVIRGVFVCFIILGVALVSNVESVGSLLGLYPIRVGASETRFNSLILDTNPSPTPLPPFTYHFPLAYKLGRIELNGAWINNSKGQVQYGFLSGDANQFVVDLVNFNGSDVSVNLTWSQDGPCGESLVMDREFILKPGTSQEVAESTTPDCLGIYTNTVKLSFGSQTESLVFNSVVINPSSVVVANGQGFDKCSLPTVGQMATWWDNSPYATVNIYLGGISAACSMNRDSAWLYQVAQQGWSFILTWVGPQAPCTSFNHQMSSDPATAYQQGKNNADAAVATAKLRGFLGDLAIYYDLESYSKGKDDPECRVAAASFLQGWVEQIHELGYTAGAYGAGCSSFMSEWAANDDPPDSVWLAHWYTNYYDPDATVDDVPCIDNGLWFNHQRLKQYTGGHDETWGGKKLKIDSNVLDGQVSAVLGLQTTPQSGAAETYTSSAKQLSPGGQVLRQMQLLAPETGWALQGERLLWTEDGGTSWRDISPTKTGRQSEILDLTFLDAQIGWLVQRVYSPDQPPTLAVLHTVDGGETWQEATLPLNSTEDVMQVESAAIDLLDKDSIWIAVKLHSSSNFSFGRLFGSQDGGHTWQERTLPLGEPVKFSDAQHGWIAGGPANQTYFTEDGGESWNLSETFPEDQPFGQATPILPTLAVDDHLLAGEVPQGVVALEMTNGLIGWALVQDGNCSGYKPLAGEVLPSALEPLQCESYSRLLKTTDGGNSWLEITPAD